MTCRAQGVKNPSVRLNPSARAMAAATTTFSERAGGRIGMKSRACAAA
jgi:hypothetical protein